MKKYKPVIESVCPGSIADYSGIRAGEMLVGINGTALRDMIDYQYLAADEVLELTVADENGNERTLAVEKDDDEDLGIGFQSAVFDGIRKCCNRCIFCFVDQMIPGQRETLYVKDDDYRLSFLYGNYITLTNLSDEDFERIKAQRLSPLYISVHCLDPVMRGLVLGREDKRPIVAMLNKLSDSGIEMHGQIVLAPGFNDGKYLIETIEGIAAIAGFLSLALVPVGLTKAKNPNLRPYTKAEAKAIIDLTNGYQKRFWAEKGTRFLFAADEFYLLAEETVPVEDDYEDYPQIENGVGLIRQFREDYFLANEDIGDFAQAKTIYLITGFHGAEALKTVIADLNAKKNLTVKALVVKNHFFGETVTVTGLLTGNDIIDALVQNKDEGAIYLLPDVLLKYNTELLLDGVSTAEIAEKSGCDVRVTQTNGMALADAVAEIREELI